MIMMLFILTIIISAIVVGLSARGIANYRLPRTQTSEEDLPSVSLLIPARNETHTITRALTAATALNYPKLEIIVLDDQSQDNTSEKIRSFAQDGVRFVAGEPLPEHWIGKNWATQQLSEHASGEYLLFSDIDVQLSSKGLTRLMRAVVRHNLVGASLQPRLIPNSPLSAAAFPFLIWSTQLLGRSHPKIHPSFGGLQLYRKSAWKQHGGFTRYKNDILAEFMLAKNFRRMGSFRFIRNSSELGIAYIKSQSTLDGARMRYLRTLPSTSSILFLLHIMCLISPLMLLLIYPILYPVIALAAAFILYNQHKYWLLCAILLPLAAVYELILLLGSALHTIFRPASWKDRLISN